jgi:hypothetical protein
MDHLRLDFPHDARELSDRGGMGQRTTDAQTVNCNTQRFNLCPETPAIAHRDHCVSEALPV